MIIARFTVQDSDVGRHLVGATTSNWPLAVGTRLVLRKERDGTYALLEIGERKSRLPSEQALLSFVDEEER